MSVSGMLKGSYVPVAICWNFDIPYDGTAIGAKTVTGAITGTFPGGQVPVDRTGTVTVSEQVIYAIGNISDLTMKALTEGYKAGTQEIKTITVTRTGNGDLANLSVAVNGGDNSFQLTQPEAVVLNSGITSTTFTVKAKDGLLAGIYTGTIAVSADYMDAVIFTVTQVVSELTAPNILLAEPGDEQVSIEWRGVPEATGYNIYVSTNQGDYGRLQKTVSEEVYASVITGLDNGTTYYFAVASLNGMAESAYSEQISAMPQVAAPGVPVLNRPVAGDRSVRLSWGPVSKAVKYVIFSRIDGTVEYDQELTVSKAVYGTEVTGLENGSMYWFRVRAVNPGGYADSAEKSAMPGTVPGAPAGVSAVARNGQAVISFTAPSDDKDDDTQQPGKTPPPANNRRGAEQ